MSQYDTIYTRLVSAEIEIDNYHSDLYVLDCPESRRIIKQYQQDKPNHRLSMRQFQSNIDNRLWIDIAFCFDPFWEKRYATK
jgi:phage gp36-like protein